MHVGGDEPSVVQARQVVNASGLHAQNLARQIVGLSPDHVPAQHWARGHYFALAGRPAFQRLIYPLPEPGGLGVHLTLDLAGQMRFGPDVQWVPVTAPGRRDDDATTGHTHEVIHIKPAGPLDCSDGQVLHDWCLAGCGIAWRSSWEVESEVAAGRLVAVLQDYAAPANGIFAVFPQRRLLPLRVRLWIDFLKHHYAQPEFWRAG